MKIRGRKKSEQGSAIVWASVVLAMLCILVTAALSVGFRYHERCMSANARRQAYYTARSVAETVAGTIEGSGGLTSAYLPQSVGDTLTLSRIDGLPDTMGEATATVSRTGDYTASVTANAVFNGQSYAYTVDLTTLCINVPAFRNGLYTEDLDDVELEALDGDLYICGASTQQQPFLLNFPVTGNVYAPNGAVLIGPAGAVGGSIFAQSIAGNASSTPLLAAACGSITNMPSLTQCEQVPADVFASMFDGVYDPDAQTPVVSMTGAVQLTDSFSDKLTAGGVYYVAEGESVSGLDLKAQGKGTVYIVLYQSASLEIEKTTLNSNQQKIVFILKRNAQVTLKAPSENEFALSVYGEKGASFSIASDNKKKTLDITGVISIDSFSSDRPVNYQADGDAAGGRSNLVPLRWAVSKKELGE
ncbi:MAG: hypothetical protein VB092_05145 [Oscillospiraceae bacterium]|nr:hypothetical protein [Oscillospiraceae bacterium]